MNYADNQNKFAVVVNRTVAPTPLLNAVAHCCGGLAERVGAQAEFLDYPSPAGQWTARISRWPVIILAAKNGNQMARFVGDANERNLVFNCFTGAMLGESAQQQQSQVAGDSAPEYWAVAAFGEASAWREITRRFSLYRSDWRGQMPGPNFCAAGGHLGREFWIPVPRAFNRATAVLMTGALVPAARG